MRTPFFLAVLALLLTIDLGALIAQESKAAPQEQKHLIAFAGNGWENRISAGSIERTADYPGIIYLKVNVEIKTPLCPPIGNRSSKVCDTYMVLRADAAEFHEETGQIEAHGNVSVIPASHETGTRPAARQR